MTSIARSAALLLGLALSAAWFAPAASASAPCTTPASGGEWPMYGHDVANTRAQPEPSGLGPTAVSGLKPAWTFSTSSAGDETGFNTTPVVYGGGGFIGWCGGGGDGRVARCGRGVWRRK